MKHLTFLLFAAVCIISKVVADVTVVPAPLSELERKQGEKVAFYKSLEIEVLPGHIRKDTAFDAAKYVGVSKVVIDTSVTVSISSNSRFYFEPNCAIIVKGKLLVSSSNKWPIIFSAVPSNYRFDSTITDSLWNGIILEKHAELLLDNAAITDAQTGLRINDSARSFNLQCVNMSHNTPIPVMHQNRVVSVNNGACISNADIFPDTLSKSDKRPGITLFGNKPLSRTADKAIKIGSCLLAAGGTGVALFGLYAYNKYGSLYTSSVDPRETTPDQVDTYRDKAKSGGVFGIAGAIAGLIGATGLTVSFAF